MQLINHPHDGDLFSNNWKIDIKSETQAAEEPFTGFGNAEDGE